MSIIGAFPGGEGSGGGPKWATYVIGTTTAGHTAADCDILCDGENDVDIIRNAINQGAKPSDPESILINQNTKIFFLKGKYQIKYLDLLAFTPAIENTFDLEITGDNPTFLYSYPTITREELIAIKNKRGNRCTAAFITSDYAMYPIALYVYGLFCDIFIHNLTFKRMPYAPSEDTYCDIRKNMCLSVVSGVSSMASYQNNSVTIDNIYSTEHARCSTEDIYLNVGLCGSKKKFNQYCNGGIGVSNYAKISVKNCRLTNVSYGIYVQYRMLRYIPNSIEVVNNYITGILFGGVLVTAPVTRVAYGLEEYMTKEFARSYPMFSAKISDNNLIFTSMMTFLENSTSFYTGDVSPSITVMHILGLLSITENNIYFSVSSDSETPFSVAPLVLNAPNTTGAYGIDGVTITLEMVKKRIALIKGNSFKYRNLPSTIASFTAYTSSIELGKNTINTYVFNNVLLGGVKNQGDASNIISNNQTYTLY